MLPPPSNTVSPGSTVENSTTVVSTPVSKFRAAAAFTLVEMLVVIGVVALIIGLAVPTFKNLVGGRGVEKSIDSVTGLLELGRATAIANRTYVYVLFKNVIDSDNNCELRCGAVMAINNLNYFDANIMKPISKLVRITNVKNVRFSQMPLSVRRVTPSELASDGSYIAGWYSSETASAFPAVTITGENFKGATFVCFNHDGEIATSGDPYNMLVEQKICLGLIATRGSTVPANATDGAIVAAYGGSGMMRVVRP